MLKQKNKEMTKTKQSSLDLPELEQPSSPKRTEKSKTSESAIWNKLSTIGDLVKAKNNHQPNQTNKNNQTPNDVHKKSKTQSTLDYFLKSKPKDVTRSEKRKTIGHSTGLENGRPTSLQKQMSVGSYPVLLNIPEEAAISRDRPATVCGDKPGAEHSKKTVAFAIDRPRKNLSFKEPETGSLPKSFMGFDSFMKKSSKSSTPQMNRSLSYNNENNIHRSTSYEDFDLEVNLFVTLFKILT